MNWIHNGKEMLSHDDFTLDVVGFVYCITYDNNKKYVGKKLIRSELRLKPTKEQLAIRKNYKRVEMKNKPYVNYAGSSKNTDGLRIVSKEILELCSDKLNLSYAETKWLMRLDVLCDDMYLNENVSGTYYRGKITKGL